MKEIPLPLIKANQLGIVVFVLFSFIFQAPLFIYLLFLIQLIPYVFGIRANQFIRLAKLFLSQAKLQKAETEAAELARFNQSIAVIMLGISSVTYLAGWSVIAYVASAIVATAALVSVLGYCIGCTIYFQYKKWKNLSSRTHS